MAEPQLQQFLEKVRQLNAFVALSEEEPELRQQLQACNHHQEVVNLARCFGFEIGRRWGEADSWGEAASRPKASLADNIFFGPCPPIGAEHTTVLLEQPGLRLERIHSCQASSPEGFWYDQAEHEWVLLLQGSAELQFADEAPPQRLCRGASLLIKAHRRHRLVSTDPVEGCIWLALFWPAVDPG